MCYEKFNDIYSGQGVQDCNLEFSKDNTSCCFFALHLKKKKIIICSQNYQINSKILYCYSWQYLATKYLARRDVIRRIQSPSCKMSLILLIPAAAVLTLQPRHLLLQPQFIACIPHFSIPSLPQWQWHRVFSVELSKVCSREKAFAHPCSHLDKKSYPSLTLSQLLQTCSMLTACYTRRDSVF